MTDSAGGVLWFVIGAIAGAAGLWAAIRFASVPFVYRGTAAGQRSPGESGEAAGRLAANLSREIRTGVNSILGTADLLAGTELAGEQREYVETIRSSAASLLTIAAGALEVPQAEASEPAAPGPPRIDPHGLHVLLAEDHPVNRIVVTRLLERLGCRVRAVLDGYEAIVAAAGERYDLILLDIQMPGLDGFAAAAEIRRAEGEARHVPIVAVTASAMPGDRERCLASGMDDYLSKPVTLEQLRGVLERWVKGAP